MSFSRDSNPLVLPALLLDAKEEMTGQPTVASSISSGKRRGRLDLEYVVGITYSAHSLPSIHSIIAIPSQKTSVRDI